ncbi:MAG: hypothetical protein IJB31_00970 [Akkermansia sp.]|nr:hypothetical protein [Akkermansia sp.]
MKRNLCIALLLGLNTAWGVPAPTTAAHHSIRLNMEAAEIARTGLNEAPGGIWYKLDNLSPLQVSFPEIDTFTASTTYGADLSSDICATYIPQKDSEAAVVKLSCPDFSAVVKLNFTAKDSGTAEITWNEAGETRHLRGASFTMRPEGDATGILLPMEQPEGDPPLWNDGLASILSNIESTVYHTATDKLYQKRLVSLLPLVMVMHNASYTTPDFKGNTALHYACGLSQLELVTWLVNHGADLEARTDKGATIDACVSGRNAASIKSLLKRARTERDTAPSGPIVDEDTARAMAGMLETAFSCADIRSAAYRIPQKDTQVEQAALALYSYVKSKKCLPAWVDKTEPLGNLLELSLRAKISEAMYLESLTKQLTTLRQQALAQYRNEGKALAMLPYMMSVREADHTWHDGATAMYRAAKEGNVGLVRWLLKHGIRHLRNERGETVGVPDNAPNASLICSILAPNSPRGVQGCIAPEQVVGKTLCMFDEKQQLRLSINWQHSNAESEGEIKENEDWCIEEKSYKRTGDCNASVTLRTQWAPGGSYAAGWRDITIDLTFTSGEEGTATYTECNKQGEESAYTGTFTLK